MSNRVAGKVAFITGAGRGQGRSHALRLAEEGADIIAVDACTAIETVDYALASSDDLAETAELVQKLGRRVVTAEADVRDFDALSEAVRLGVAELGRLDIVCANAGILSTSLSHYMSETAWQTMIDVNLTGVWHTTKATTPTLIEQGTGGSIIITSSLMGLKGDIGLSHYTATKFGLVGLSRSLAKELAPYRIRVNTVNPTSVDTPMIDNDEIRRRFRPDLTDPTVDDVVPLLSSLNIWPKPWIEVEDVSNAVLFLASDESRSITAISLSVDFGASAK